MMRQLFAALAAFAMMTGATAAAAENWIRAESPHFVVYSDTGVKLTSAYVARLEQYRYILQNVYGIETADEGQFPKFQMYFLKDVDDLHEVWSKAPDYVGGFFKACTAGQAAFAIDFDDQVTRSKVITSQPENVSQIVIFHEYAHQFMFENADKLYPHWFIEGFADYYGTSRMLDDQIAVGVAPSQREWDLNNRAWLPFDRILRGDVGVNDHQTIGIFYAQSWLLMHYMMATPERQAQMEAYINAYNQGEDPITSFEKATGIAVKDLARTLTRYHVSGMQAIIYKVRDLPAPQIDIAAMPKSSEKLLLWNASALACMAWGPDKDSYLQKVRTEAAQYPDDDYALRALARIEIIVGDEAKAVPYLSKVIATNPDDAEATSLLGEAWLLMSIHGTVLDGQTKASQMKVARDLLLKAYRLDPLNVSTLYNLSRSQQDLPGYPNDTAINAMMQANILAPSVSTFSTDAAGLLIRKERLDEARTMLLPTASNPHGGNTVAWARAIVDAIDAGKPAEDVTALFNTPVAPEEPAGDAKDKKGGKAA